MAAIRKRQRAAEMAAEEKKEKEKVAKSDVVYEHTFKPREHPSLPDFKCALSAHIVH